MRNKSFPASWGCFLGMMGGIISTIIASFLYWVSLKFSFTDQLYLAIGFDIIFYGLPIIFSIGSITYLLNAVFKITNPKALLWAVVVSLGTTASLLASGLNNDYNNQFGFILEFAFIGLSTGWMVHKFTASRLMNDTSEPKRAVIIISAILGFVLVFVATFFYFRFLHYTNNIRS